MLFPGKTVSHTKFITWLKSHTKSLRTKIPGAKEIFPHCLLLTYHSQSADTTVIFSPFTYLHISSEEPQIAQGSIIAMPMCKFLSFSVQPQWGKRRVKRGGKHESGLQISADYNLRNLMFFNIEWKRIGIKWNKNWRR